MVARPSATHERSRRDLWLLRVVALVISILLWITVFGGKNGETSKRVALEYRAPNNLVISNPALREVLVRVQGPRVFLKEFQERQITMNVDLTRHSPGDYEILLSEEMLDIPLGIKLVSMSQSAVPVKLERAVTKVVPVKASFAGPLPEGLKLRSTEVKPAQVEVRGAESRMNRIDGVSTEPIRISPTALRQTLSVPLSFTDLPTVTVRDRDRSVEVTIELEGQLSRKWLSRVPVQVRLADGRPVNMSELKLKITPNVVNVFVEGPEPSVEKVEALQAEVWAEIPSQNAGSYRAKLDVQVPAGLRVVRRSHDVVEVQVPTL